MNRGFLALALALSVFPIAALADDNNTPPSPPTPAQRQAIFQTFEKYRQQEEQLHQQLRYQILSSLTPVHRRYVGTLIGELAVAPNPDFEATAKQLDRAISGSEQSRILAAHQQFETQSKALHEQMKTELQSELPAGAQQRWGHHDDQNRQDHAPRQYDAGTLLLKTLSPGHDMMGDDHGPMMMMHGGPPPQH
jgi:hypothetical protein